MRRDTDRFGSYREIQARFDSTATCGHSINKGEYIGWNPRAKKTQCAECWARWVAENSEAELYESSMPDFGM